MKWLTQMPRACECGWMCVKLVVFLVLASCGDRARSDEALARSLGTSLVAACPDDGDRSSETARDACADRLVDLDPLRGAMREPFIWGGQAPSGGYGLDKGTTKLNPRVWRRMYLSTFSFGAGYSVERSDGDVVLHVPVRFRGEMPPGAYPYPFWHSAKKWDAYNYATTIHFVVRDGIVLGALRGVAQDRTRPKIDRAWDGHWGWERDGTAEPHASLYSYLFSAGNPLVPALDAAYRSLEADLRRNRCHLCHAPDNRGGAPQLELLVYPNQALSARHDIVSQLSDDTMPPENSLGVPPGVDDDDRRRLTSLALAFEAAGDAALAWEDARAK